MFKVFKYKLYPTKNQIYSIIFQLKGHRFLYNQALEQRKKIYKETGKGINYTTQATTLLPKLKKENKNLVLCNYSSLQQTLRKLDKSFKSFFHRIKSGEKAGYPLFKSADRFNSIIYASLGDGCQIKANRLYLQNIGCIKVKWHRPIIGNIKTVTVIRKNNKWYASFVVECKPNYLPKTNKSIGIDVGLNHFISTSDGMQIRSPKYLRQSERKLTKSQRQLSHKKNGSNRRKKARILVAKNHEKVSNQRLDFCHKTTYFLVQNYDGFAVENLNIKNMSKNRYLAKSISDAGWGMFLNILKSKAENAGRGYKEIDPKWTSQKCSTCGEIVKKSLAVRMHNCPHCGLSLDRDINAALNILQKAWIEPSWRVGNLIPLVETRSRLL